ncbi:hypothetical protein XELAEV_18045650mg [Xenopus laevis]|uniref:Uncharacterized protein n=1 Tax=Xenopus laevis TaxID=8355 RepID=A0A974C1B7_XENLA|nr:hypothetical protein XELAEV_18045650mg [Xenopus laevis]
MKLILLCLVIVTLQLQGTNPETTKSPDTKPAITKRSGPNPTTTKRAGLECYDCNIRTCKKKHSAPCKSTEDTCMRISRKIVGYDGTPDRENEFNPTMNVLVWERKCTTAADCKKRQSDTRLGKMTSCCNKNLCNA